MRYTILILIAFSLSAHAYSSSPWLTGRTSSQSGGGVQWTLADWLTEKGRMRTMDQWLALHTSRKGLDLSITGGAQKMTLTTDNGSGTTASTSESGQEYEANLNFSIFNINGFYEKTNYSVETYGGAAGFRLFGTSSQSTSLTARYGWQRRTDLKTPEKWENQYAEGALQLYIFSHFGLTGGYRYYFPAKSNLGNQLQGNKVTAGAFIESGFIRVYANYFQEPLQITSAGVITKETTQGYQAGAGFYF